MSSRNQSLDVLRGIAILLVLGRHAPYIEYSPHVNFWFRIGWSGVDLFFVLSGFLISGLLFTEFKRNRTIDIKRFWIRRGLKIYPAFYTLVGFLAAISLFRTGHIARALLGDALFMQNYLPHVIDHGWSLAVEEHFYFILPLFFGALTWMGRKSSDPFRAIPLTSLALTVACLAMRIRSSSNHALWDQIAYPTHLRIDALFLGVTLGYYFHFQSLEVRRKWLLALFGCLLLLPAFAFGTASLFTATVGLTMTSLGYACVLIWALQCQWQQFGALAWVGRYSYSVYLWHMIIAMLCANMIGQTPLSFWIYLVGSLIVGVGMAKLIELPVLRIRERLIPAVAQVRQTADVDNPALEPVLLVPPG
jgi:peptidoglycan/LPS O-acetylase OafA/YrhL